MLDRCADFRQRLVQALVDARDNFFGDTDRRVDDEAAHRAAHIELIALKGGVDKHHGCGKVGKHIGYAVAHRSRYYAQIDMGDGFKQQAVEHLVELVDSAIDRFQRVMIIGYESTTKRLKG